ncbi:MAG: hypothetical protein AAGG50_03640 [Bacteroidota bacterium]
MSSYDSCWEATSDISIAPDFADEIFEPFPVGSINPATFDEESITAFFYEQSKLEGDPHFLFGDVWPKDENGNPMVYEAKNNMAWYDNVSPRRGLGNLVKEAMDYLRDSTNINFTDYDRDGDGFFDRIFLI